MPQYNLSAVITLNSIDLQATIEADTEEEARAIFEKDITDGHFNEELDARAVGRDFEVDDIQVI